MIKTLLFGAGPGAVNYISNQQGQRHFIGLIDNDSGKHGTDYAGLFVYSVSALQTLIFDQIVITTQWSTDVKNQLINELKIDERLIVIPPKAQLKASRPFEHQPTLELARLLIRELSSRGQQEQVLLWVDFGTLLGLVREQDIIPWDDDIDFAITADTATMLPHWLDTTLANISVPPGWSIEVLYNIERQPQSISLHWPNSKHIKPFIVSFSVRTNQDGMSRHMPSLGMWYAPSSHFSTQDWIEWQDCQVPVPKNKEDYLHFVYGDWKTPKKQIQLTDYANLQPSSFKSFQAAGLHSQKLY